MQIQVLSGFFNELEKISMLNEHNAVEMGSDALKKARAHLLPAVKKPLMSAGKIRGTPMTGLAARVSGGLRTAAPALRAAV